MSSLLYQPTFPVCIFALQGPAASTVADLRHVCQYQRPVPWEKMYENSIERRHHLGRVFFFEERTSNRLKNKLALVRGTVVSSRYLFFFRSTTLSRFDFLHCRPQWSATSLIWSACAPATTPARFSCRRRRHRRELPRMTRAASLTEATARCRLRKQGVSCEV